MAILTSIYKKNKGTNNSTTPLNADAIVDIFYSIIPKVNVFSVNSRIFAKESMNMPMMARDTNITRQNIAKLVKLQGASPTKKADSFFERASEREKLYESNFSKESSALKSKPIAPIGVSGFAQKAVNFGAISLGLVGFFGALTLAGNLISRMPGAFEGLKNMFVALGEGLSALSIGSLLKFGALLGAGALFGQTSFKFQGKAVIGIGAVGLGIGAFFSGLALGGVIGTFIDNSDGIRDMMVNLAEGLNAFNTQSLVAFGALLGAGALFGDVKGTIGIAAIGLGIGAFFSALSLGAKGLDLFGGDPTKLKDLLVNFAEGLNAISELDGMKLLALTITLPAFGIALQGFLLLKGIGAIAEKITSGIDKGLNFLLGGEYKSPIQKIAEDMKKISEISDLTKANDGVKNLVETLTIIASLSGDTIQKSINKTGLILAIIERLNSGKFPTLPTAPGAQQPGSQPGSLPAARNVEENLYTGPFGIPGTSRPTQAPAAPAARPTPDGAINPNERYYSIGGGRSISFSDLRTVISKHEGNKDSVYGDYYQNIPDPSDPTGKRKLRIKVNVYGPRPEEWSKTNLDKSKPLSEFTFTELLAYMKSRPTSTGAAGIAGFMPTTIFGPNLDGKSGLFKDATMAWDDKFSEENQRKIQMVMSGQQDRILTSGLAKLGIREITSGMKLAANYVGSAGLLWVIEEGMKDPNITVRDALIKRHPRGLDPTKGPNGTIINKDLATTKAKDFVSVKEQYIAGEVAKLNIASVSRESVLASAGSAPASTGGSSAPTTVSAAPSVGATIASSSSAINQVRMSMNATPPTVVVNNSGASKDKNKPVDGKIASTMDFDFTDSMLGAPIGA